ncbi:MAG: helix-turn-helix domain-containing protein [Pseudomonadota bacterium]
MNLREWRKMAGLTGGRAAKLVGTAQSHWSGIETGNKRPSPGLAERIEAATNGEVTAAELLGLNATVSAQGMGETSRTFEYETQAVTVAVPGYLSRAASDLGVNIEDELSRGGLPTLKQAVTDAFLERYKDAIEGTNEYVRKHGTLSQQFGMI